MVVVVDVDSRAVAKEWNDYFFLGQQRTWKGILFHLL